MSSTRWLRRCGGADAPALRLVCLPYAGAGAAVYQGWRLPPELSAEVWSVQPPGRESRFGEPPLRRVEPMVRAIAEALEPLSDRPFALFGHSMGALLAFEVCRYLRRTGRPLPVRLLASAHRAPHLPPWRPAVSPLGEPQFFARLDEMAGVSQTVITDRELLKALAPTIRADFELCETYRFTAEDPLDIPFTCFAAADDPEVRLDEVDEWRWHTTAPSKFHRFTGGHLFLRDRAADLLAQVAGDLATAAR